MMKFMVSILKFAKHASVAQSVELLPRKQVVGGSNPSRGLISGRNWFLVRVDDEEETG